MPTLGQIRHLPSSPDTSQAVGSVNYWVNAPAAKGKSIVVPIFWPNEFVHRAGAADLTFDKLTLPELVCGSLRAITTTNIPPEERAARLGHLIDLMIFAEQYKWDRVRALYEEVLGMIQQGRRPWEAGVRDLKEEMLRPPDLLSANKPPPKSTPQQPCRAWNYGREGCSKGESCYFKHGCAECARAGTSTDSHRGKDCPKKKAASK